MPEDKYRYINFANFFTPILFSIPRKGIPIKSPHERLDGTNFRRSSSSHDLLSPLNTLDCKSTSSVRPVAKPSPSLPRTLTPAFPLKVDKLPSSFTGNVSRNDGPLETLLKKYPTDTFCTEAHDFKNVTVERGSDKQDSEYFDVASAGPSNGEKIPKIKSRESQSSPSRSSISSSDQKQIRVSTIQYRHLIIPPCKSLHKYTKFKLIFLQKERMLVLSCVINNSPNLAVLSLGYSKVLKIQFIRKECASSSDWYIDFVMAPEVVIDLQPFKAPPDSASPHSHIDTFSHFSTLRVCLDSDCGASVSALDNILLSIINDRRAFYFAEAKDHYGDFEKSNRTSSPDRPRKTLNYSPDTYNSSSKSALNSSPRHVPSLESLYASDSVKIKSRRQVVIENDQIYASNSSPDVFESTYRRQSKRNRLTSPKDVDFAYVDPEFESECVKLFSYPEGDLDSVQVTSHELQRLDPGIWLNDTLIDFELKFLLHKLDINIQEKIHVFSSFFYRRLSSAKMTLSKSDEEQSKKTGFELVRTWTRKVNLFEKDFIVLPINENLHWFLVIICHPSKMLTEATEASEQTNEDPRSESVDDVPIVDLDAENDRARIFIFDSLGLTSRGKSTTVISKLRTYLQLEAQDKLGRPSNKSACTGHVIKVPQQENYTDCGCFVLQFAEEFFKNINKNIVDKIVEVNYDLSKWFPPQLAQDRRNVMKGRIESLAADYAARQLMRQETGPKDDPSKQEEDRSSDIEEIIM